MAVDLRIELFAYDLFQSMWYKHKLIPEVIKASKQYPEEKLKDPEYEELFEDHHLQAVIFYQSLFKSVYNEEVKKFHEGFMVSTSGVSEYLFQTCSREDYFGDFLIFDRIFATCAFVAQVCLFCYRHGHKDIIHCAHRCWAMYFDEYKEKFYGNGGWSQLHQEAMSYYFLGHFYKLNCMNPELNSRIRVDSAITNHISFDDSYLTSVYDSKTHAKNWVDFHFKRFLNPEGPPPKMKNFPRSPNSNKDGTLVRHLKYFCDMGDAGPHKRHGDVLTLDSVDHESSGSLPETTDEDFAERISASENIGDGLQSDAVSEGNGDLIAVPYPQSKRSDIQTNGSVTENSSVISLELDQKCSGLAHASRNKKSYKLTSDYSKSESKETQSKPRSTNVSRLQSDVSSEATSEKQTFSTVCMDQAENSKTECGTSKKDTCSPEYEIITSDIDKLVLVLKKK